MASETVVPQPEIVDGARAPDPDDGEATIRKILLKEDLPADKWMLRRNWMRLSWMTLVVAFIFLFVYLGYAMMWGAYTVVAVVGLESLFFLIALFAYLSIILRKRRTRLVHVRKIAE